MNQRIKENTQIIILILISSLGVIAGSLIAPIEVRFIQSLVSNPILIGLTFSIGTFFMFIFSVYLGRKSIIIGKRRILFIGLLAGIFYPFIYATSLNVFQYMFGRVAWALACVASGPMVIALFQDIISKRKNIAELSGWLFSVTLVGRFIDKTSPLTGLKIAFILYTFSLFFLSLSKDFIPFIIGAIILSLGKTYNGPVL